MQQPQYACWTALVQHLTKNLHIWIGNDSITGGGLGDALSGNAGNDTITGGLGIDSIALGDGANTIIFTGGLTTDIISGFTSNDIGSFDLSELEKDDAVEDGETLNFANGAGTGVLASDSISCKQLVAITLAATTNVLNYTKTVVQNAAALKQ